MVVIVVGAALVGGPARAQSASSGAAPRAGAVAPPQSGPAGGARQPGTTAAASPTAGQPARVVPGAVCVVPASGVAAQPAAGAQANPAAMGTAGFGASGAPTTPISGVPAVGRDPCVQLVACYARLAATLCSRTARACRRAFTVDTSLPAEECRARLADAGLHAAPFAGPAFTIPDACVD